MTKSNELKHYGVLGMRWGIRRDKSSSGGSRRSSDYFGKSRKSIKNMSNNELRSRINRMQLEKQYKSLRSEMYHPARRFVAKMLKDVGGQMAKDVVQNSAGYAVNKVTGKKIFKTRYGKK